MSSEGSIKAVMIALIGNFAIAILKFIVAMFTKSAGMLAESIHSLADTVNEVFLLIGSKRSKKEADEDHAFGHGKEEYFWGFLVAFLLFSVGGTYSIFEGIHKIANPEKIEHALWLFIIIVISIGIELNSFLVALGEFKHNKAKKTSWLRHFKNSTNTNVFVIIVEDFSALSGLGIILITTILALTINPIFDAIGSILVGLLLIMAAYYLSNELRKLMIGENIPREMRDKIKEIIRSFKDVKHINYIKSMYIGNDQFILLISIDVDDNIKVYHADDIVSEIKRDVISLYDNAKYILVEIE